MSKYKLSWHNSSFSDRDFVVNGRSGLKKNDVVEIYLSDDPCFHLILKVEDLRDEIKPSDISIDEAIARQFQMCKYEFYIVQRLEPHQVQLEMVELVLRDQYMSRCDQWRFSKKLIGDCVHQKKSVQYAHMRCQVFSMWMKGSRVSSGYIGNETRIIFRSLTAKVFIFVQISSELWKFDHHGDLCFEKTTDGFFADLFEKWKKFNCQHHVSIILFSRIFYKTRCLSELPEPIRHSVSVDFDGRLYEDFYNVICQFEHHDDWLVYLPRIKDEISKYKDAIRRQFVDSYSDESPPDFYLSCAAEGNLFEALNHAANAFDAHSAICEMDYLGQFCVVVTGGCGFFLVDRELFDITNKRFMEKGLALDLVCVCEQPLYAVPLVKFVNSQSFTEDFFIPHFINISFYRNGYGFKSEKAFIPRVKVSTRFTHKNELLDSNCVLRKNHPPQHDDLSGCELYDLQVFNLSKRIGLEQPSEIKKKEIFVNTNRRRHITCDFADLTEGADSHESRCRSNTIAIKTSSLTVDEKPAGRFSKSTRSSSLDSGMKRVSSNKEKHYQRQNSASERYLKYAPYRQHSHMLTFPDHQLGLVNPFNPKGTRFRINFYRRRWALLFPIDEFGCSIHHHYATEEPGKSDQDQSNKYPWLYYFSRNTRSPDEKLRESIKRNDAKTVAFSNPSRSLISKAHRKTNTFMKTFINSYDATAWGPTASEEWSSDLCIAVDWKSLVVPACYPLFTDYIPEFESIKEDFVECLNEIPLLLIRQQMIQKELIGNLSSYSIDQVYSDMIGLRLSKGFQIIAFNGSSMDSTPDKEAMMKWNELLPTNIVRATQFMSIGKIFHVLQLIAPGNEELENIKIIRTEFKPKFATKTHPIFYNYRYKALETMKTFAPSCCIFYCDEADNVKWGDLDHYVCVQDNTEENQFTKNIKCWKLRLLLLPHVPQNKERTHDLEDGFLSLNEADLFERLKAFIRFLEMLNKLRHYNIAQSNNSRSEKIQMNDASSNAEIELLSKSTPVDKVIEEMKSNLSFVTHVTHSSMPKYTFISAECVWWCMESFVDIVSVRDAVNYLQDLLDNKLISHVSRETRFYFGFYLYYIVSDEGLKVEKRPREFCEVRFFNSESYKDFPRIESFRRNGSKRLLPQFLSSEENASGIYGSVNVDVDPNKKSERYEWASATYSLFYHPMCAFELTLNWLLATGTLLSDLVATWSRKSILYGFTFIHIPVDPYPEFYPSEAWKEIMKDNRLEKIPFQPSSFNMPASLHIGYVHKPFFIRLRVEFLKDYPEFASLDVCTQWRKIYVFQELMLSKHGFLLNHCVIKDPSNFTFYVHYSGCALISVENEIGKLDAPACSNVLAPWSSENIGFQWMSNFSPNKRWKVSHVGNEEYAEKILSEFKNLCSNEAEALSEFWKFCSQS